MSQLGAESGGLSSLTMDTAPITLGPSSGGTMRPREYNPTELRSAPMRKLSSVLARTTDTHLYEVAVGMSCTIVSMWITSTDTGAATIRLHHCRGGESTGTSNALFYDATVSAKTTVVYDSPIYLASGDRLWVSASVASKVCFTVYGAER